MGKPRLPWKRGPIAWKVANESDVILGRLAACPRRFLSLRRASAVLGVSTQPLRDWIKLGYLRRVGPRQQISSDELGRLVTWLGKHAEPYESRKLLERIHGRGGRSPWPFHKLNQPRFEWPKGRSALTPPELAQLVKCHPSLIVKAIRSGRLCARRKSACRWEVTHRAWQKRV